MLCRDARLRYRQLAQLSTWPRIRRACSLSLLSLNLPMEGLLLHHEWLLLLSSCGLLLLHRSLCQVAIP